MTPPTGFIESNQPSMFGHNDVVGFGNPEWHVRIIDRDLANETIKRNHYSAKFVNNSTFHFGLFIDGVMLGVLQFGYPLNPASGGNLVVNGKAEWCLELNRMWMSDTAPKNTESRAIAYCIRVIRKNSPKTKYIQSFADSRCGKLGVVYQAANFTYHGSHVARFWELDGVVYHNISMTTTENTTKHCLSNRYLQANKDRATSFEAVQHRYIYWIDNRLRKICTIPEQPYPKHGEMP